MKNFVFALSFFAIMGCDISDKSLIVSGVRQLSDLATTEVVVKKYVLGKKEKRILVIKLSDANFVAETYAYLKFGIDLSNITADDINIAGKNVTVKVPHIKLVSFRYPPSEFKEVPQLSDRWKFANNISSQDIDTFLEKAQEDIGESIPYMGIFESVKSNTELALQGLVSELGYSSVAVIVEDDQILIDKYF